MRAAVRKWGNSLALRIPKALADMTDIQAGSQVELTADAGRLVVTPVSPRFTLDALLAGVTDANRHGEVPSGRPVGRELW